MALYVGRLPFDVRTREVERLFDKYGRLVNCSVKRGVQFLEDFASMSNTVTGFAFVEFAHTRDAEDAIRALDGKEWEGDKLVVEWSKTRPGIFVTIIAFMYSTDLAYADSHAPAS